MMNRWQGNSGRVQRIGERQDRPAPPPREEPRPQPKPQTGRRPAHSLPPLFSAPAGRGQGGLLSGLEGLKKLIPSKAGDLETEDIILLLILYLMYRESGDQELLMIMGAMFLL